MSEFSDQPSPSEPSESIPEIHTQIRPKKKRRKKPQKDPRFHVVLWNDDEHTFQYVIHLLQVLFGYPPERGFQIAKQVDRSGRAIIFTSSLGEAELKRDQILAFGPDPFLEESNGPLCATLEKDRADES